MTEVSKMSAIIQQEPARSKVEFNQVENEFKELFKNAILPYCKNTADAHVGAYIRNYKETVDCMKKATLDNTKTAVHEVKEALALVQPHYQNIDLHTQAILTYLAELQARVGPGKHVIMSDT